MAKINVKDLIEQNQAELDSIFIHFEKEKKDKYDPLTEILWEGYLKNVPEKYMEHEVLQVGRSLADNEKGINGFYIQIKEPVLQILNKTDAEQ